MSPSIAALLEADPLPWVVAWGVPIAYLLLCIIMNRINKRLEVTVPDDVPPTPSVPDLHPVLLGALRCHEESEVFNERNAYGVALAAIVHMLGHRTATFTAHGHGASFAVATDENEGPIVAQKRRNNRLTFRERLIHSYGAHLQLTVNDPGASHCDLEALKIVMPSDTLTASVEELCRQAGDADQYQRLRRFLKNFAEDLCAAGLAHKSNPILHLVFNPFVNLIVCLWCLFGPAAALTEPGPEIAAVSVGLIIAVMVFRAALVDVGLKLTPEGGRILAQAKATVRWAKMEILGDTPPGRDLTDEQAADVLSVLLAMGRPDLATNLADQLILREAPEKPDANSVSMAICFCARRSYIDVNTMKKDISPIGLLLECTDNLVDRMS